MNHSRIAALLLFLSCLGHSHEDKFAGNLVPGQDQPDSRVEGTGDSVKDVPASVLSTNVTDNVDDSVHIVHPSLDASDIPASATSQDGSQSEKVKKASRPVKKAETVGFVPPPEKEEEEEAFEQVDKDKLKANFIPTLPPSIIKPGRMVNGSWYIVLYASWCAHSQSALVEFLKTIQYVIDHNITDIVVGKIDIIKHNEVAKHFRVKNTPTILFFKRGTRYTFDHPVVSADNLVDFMLEIMSATITEVNSTSELAILMKNYSVIFMIVHDETIDHDWHSIYAKQARDKALKAKFALTKNPEIVQEYSLKILPSIIVLKDESAFVFKESLTGYALSKWILSEKDVAFPTVNTSTLRKYLQPVSGRRLAFLVVNDAAYQRSPSQEKAIEVIKAIALSRKMHQKYQLGLLEGGTIPKMIFRSNSIGSFPFFFAFEPYTGYYYLFQPGEQRGTISETRVTKFLNDVKAGNEQCLGGVTYLDQINHICSLGYALIQSMIVHKPYLTITTGLSVLGALCFYSMVCWQGRSNRPSVGEFRAKKVIRAKRRKEEMAKREAEDARRRIEAKEAAVLKSRDSMHLKQRHVKAEEKEQNDGGGVNSEPEGSQEEQ